MPPSKLTPPSIKSLVDRNKPAPHGAAPFFLDGKAILPPLREILRKDLGAVPEK